MKKSILKPLPKGKLLRHGQYPSGYVASLSVLTSIFFHKVATPLTRLAMTSLVSRQIYAKSLLLVFLFSFPAQAQWAKPEIRLPEVQLGKSTAPIEILFYYSFSCLHCAQFHKESLGKLKKKYIDTGKVRLIIRDAALDKISYFASTYAHMLSEKDYLKFFDLGMSKQRDWLTKKNPRQALLALAQLSGLPRFFEGEILKNDKVSDKILKRWQEAKKKYFLEGTPAFIINGKIYNFGMSWCEFEDKIKLAEKNLKQKKTLKQK